MTSPYNSSSPQQLPPLLEASMKCPTPPRHLTSLAPDNLWDVFWTEFDKMVREASEGSGRVFLTIGRLSLYKELIIEQEQTEDNNYDYGTTDTSYE